MSDNELIRIVARANYFFVFPHQLDDGAAAFWLAIIGSSVHELAALIQSVTASVSLFRFIADDM